MSKTVSQLKDSVSGVLTGINLTNVTGLDEAVERAVRVLVQKIYIPEASGKQGLTLYGGVYDYAAPSTIFAQNLIDLRPQGISRSVLDKLNRTRQETFDRHKGLLPSGYKVTFENRNGTNVMRVDQAKATQAVTLDRMNDTTGWTLAGSGSSLTEDNTVYYESPGSLRFSVAGASTATLTKAITSQSIASYEDVGVAFLAIRVPLASSLTSLSLKLGSSASAYDTVATVTTGFVDDFETNEWFLVPFDFSNSTSTGTPDWSAIDYAQVSIAHSASMTNVRVGKLFIGLPSPHDVLFGSAAIFSTSTGLSETITTDNDTIILNSAAYTLLEFETARQIALQQGSKAKAQIALLTDTLENPVTGLYPNYQSDNPNENVKVAGRYGSAPRTKRYSRRF